MYLKYTNTDNFCLELVRKLLELHFLLYIQSHKVSPYYLQNNAILLQTNLLSNKHEIFIVSKNKPLIKQNSKNLTKGICRIFVIR